MGHPGTPDTAGGSSASKKSLENYEVSRAFGTQGRKVLLLNARRVVPASEGEELILLAIEDITDRKSADEALREAHDLLEVRVQDRTAELAQLNKTLEAEVAEHKRAEAGRLDVLRRLAGAQEEERHRLAHELHDQMGQHLTVLGLGLKSLKDASPAPSAPREELQRLQDLTDLMGREVHRIAHNLRPTALDDLGLQTALGNYAEAWSGQSGVVVDFQCTGQEGQRLAPPLETALYRVVQEALTNVLKHAKARHVSLILHRTPQEAQIVVEDDGGGFDPEAVAGSGDRLGLLGMRERLTLVGGTLTVESAPGMGTTVFARIPLPPTGGNDG